jgi:hypothetical protein
MTALTIVPDPKPWTPVTCPMPDCTEDLYLIRTECIPINEDTVAADMVSRNAVTDGWKVECCAGHVLLLPPSSGCSEESASFTESCEFCFESEETHNDVERLRTVLRALAPGGEQR